MKPCNTISDIKSVHFFAQFSEEQIRRQMQSNAEGLREMHAKAMKNGKKVGGFTVAQLNDMATRFENISAS